MYIFGDWKGRKTGITTAAHNNNNNSSSSSTGMAPTTARMEAVAACASAAAVVRLLYQLKKANKRVWVRPWLAERKKDKSKNSHKNLLKELELEDDVTFHYYHRMKKEQFIELLKMLEPRITKKDTRMRKAVTAKERLSVTLRHLVTGESKQALGLAYRISHNLLSSVIPEVCAAIYDTLQPTYLKIPQTEEEWRHVQARYHSLWHFPNCVGALDGKRVLISKSSKYGSTIGYKSYSSLIMIGLVDADHKFLYLDVGSFGVATDGGVWDRCSLKGAMEKNSLNLPPPCSIPYINTLCPSVIVGDDPFPLEKYLMKPFSGADIITPERRNFNYRLERARRTSENAFGIMTAKFQIYKQPISTIPQNVQKIIMATVVLHNFLISHNPGEYAPPELLDREDHQRGLVLPGDWRREPNGALQRLPRIARRPMDEAREVREAFMTHFGNEGWVSWQDRMALLHNVY